MGASAKRLPERIDGWGLTLRRWQPSDAPLLAAAVTESLEHLRPWMDWAAAEPIGLEERRAQLARWEEEWAAGGDVALGIYVEDRVAGSCGLHRRIAPDGLEIGYWIHPAFTRRGLATTAARLLTDGAFTLPGISHVEIHHDRANQASAGVPRRLEFTFVEEVEDRITAPAEVGVEWIWRMEAVTWTGTAQ